MTINGWNISATIAGDKWTVTCTRCDRSERRTYRLPGSQQEAILLAVRILNGEVEAIAEFIGEDL